MSLGPEEIREAVARVLPAELATLVWFVAEPGLTARRYAASESLIWRDAGVLQGHMALSAASLGLGFTLVGVSMARQASRLVPSTGLHGVGLAYVGETRVRPEAASE